MSGLKHKKGRRRSELRWLQKLLTAAEDGNTLKVTSCLQNGANIGDSGTNGSALHCACRNGHLETVRVLLENDAPVGVLSDTDHTPLHIAALNGQVEMVEVLLKAGADPNIRSRFEKRSAVILATLDGWEKILALLLNNNADANLTDLYGTTALHYASEKGREGVAAILLKHGAGVNMTNRDGWTAIHMAAVNGHVAVTKELLKYHADLNCQNKYGRTPLHWACAKGYIQMVQLLLDNGACIGVMDRQLRAPAACAATDAIRQVLDLYAPNSSHTKAPTVATTTMSPAKFRYNLAARQSVIDNILLVEPSKTATKKQSAKLLKRLISSDTDTSDTDEGDQDLQINGFSVSELTNFDLKQSVIRYDRFNSNLFGNLFPMLDNNLDYLSQTIHGALRANDQNTASIVVKEAFQKIQQLQTQINDIQSQLTSGSHGVQKVLSKLVETELYRRKSEPTDNNNNTSATDDRSDSNLCTEDIRRLHHISTALSNRPNAWQLLLQKLYEQNNSIERQTIIDNIASTQKCDINRSFLGLCSWWYDQSKRTPSSILTHHLYDALRFCELDDIIDECDVLPKVLTIGNVFKRNMSSVTGPVEFNLDPVSEENSILSEECDRSIIGLQVDGVDVEIDC